MLLTSHQCVHPKQSSNFCRLINYEQDWKSSNFQPSVSVNWTIVRSNRLQGFKLIKLQGKNLHISKSPEVTWGYIKSHTLVHNWKKYPQLFRGLFLKKIHTGFRTIFKLLPKNASARLSFVKLIGRFIH